MKKSDIPILIVVVVIAGVFSLVLSNYLFAPKDKKQLTAQKVDPITADFQKPDERYFNSNAINPTQLIQIGNNVNPQPF